MKKAVIYASCSTTTQSSKSIANQIANCHEYAARNCIEIADAYIEAPASGSLRKRTLLKKLMKAAKKADWDYLLVYCVNRLSRKRSDFLKYKRKFEKHGIKIVSVSEDSTDIQELMLPPFLQIKF